jgi:rhodanese-related sulfurtransferase
VRTADEHTYALTSGVTLVPIITSPWRFDSASKRRAPAAQKRNDAFLRDGARRFPDASTPLLVHCSDGTSRSMAALRALDAAGYTRLAGIMGGYNAFTREFDAKLAWRHTDSAYDGQGGRDMCVPPKWIWRPFCVC